MELKDTIELMQSEDYKDRFKAEYFQLKIRYDKLKEMLNKWDNGQLDFKPTCPRDIYAAQIECMRLYLTFLEARADIEKVDISDLKKSKTCKKKAIISSELRSGMPVIMPTLQVYEEDENGNKSIPCNIPELSLEVFGQPQISRLLNTEDNIITIDGDFIAINGTTTDISAKTLKVYNAKIASEKHDTFELIL